MSTWLAVTTMAAICGSVTPWAEAGAAGTASAAASPATNMTFIGELLVERSVEAGPCGASPDMCCPTYAAHTGSDWGFDAGRAGDVPGLGFKGSGGSGFSRCLVEECPAGQRG